MLSLLEDKFYRSIAMWGLSIALKGDGHLFNLWLSHACKKFKGSTFYDHRPMVQAFRQAEVDLAKQGYLNAEGRTDALETAHNMANPPKVDATLTFKGTLRNGTVIVACTNGAEKTFKVSLTGVDDKALAQTFYHVDAAVIACSAGRAKV